MPFWVSNYNGKEIQVINDHANLKIKWGNMIGDISNQLDLMEILNQFVKTISVNGTNIAKDNDKNIAIQLRMKTETVIRLFIRK